MSKIVYIHVMQPGSVNFKKKTLLATLRFKIVPNVSRVPSPRPFCDMLQKNWRIILDILSFKCYRYKSTHYIFNVGIVFVCIAARGRTNIELREQFILASGVSQTMGAFVSKSPASARSPSSSGSSTSAWSARTGSSASGPITKVTRPLPTNSNHNNSTNYP